MGVYLFKIVHKAPVPQRHLCWAVLDTAQWGSPRAHPGRCAALKGAVGDHEKDTRLAAACHALSDVTSCLSQAFPENSNATSSVLRVLLFKGDYRKMEISIYCSPLIK